MIYYLAPVIMFLITVVFASLFFIPMVYWPRKNKLVNFYWAGVWVFLAIITGLSGGNNTLLLAGLDTMLIGQSMLAGVIAAFVLFVMFGWFRLSGLAILSIFNKFYRV